MSILAKKIERVNVKWIWYNRIKYKIYEKINF
jgi:hypothetical protein